MGSNALSLVVNGVGMFTSMPDVQTFRGETPAITHCKQTSVFSGNTPNLATASCPSVAPRCVMTSSCTYWPQQDGRTSSLERSNPYGHLQFFYGKKSPKTCTLTIQPKRRPLGQVVRAHGQLEYCDRTLTTMYVRTYLRMYVNNLDK